MARLFKTSGEVKDVAPRSGDRFSLQELESIFGGEVEVVRLDFGDLMVLNEGHTRKEGRLNPAATYIYGKGTGCTDLIHGDALICEEGEVE